jgi:GT2 family glycosyltransferase
VADATAGRTYVVLLNWNGWQDTIDCAESLLRMRAEDFVIIICDNASEDSSYQHLRNWAEQKQIVHKGLSEHSPKPFFFEWVPLAVETPDHAPDTKLVLIQTGSNLGFAGGCNVGLRYGLSRGDGAFFWLLNNDTIVDSEALSAQITKMKARPDLGIVGSTLLFYNDPQTVQCCAGYSFNTWTARVRPAATMTTADHLPTEASVESRLRYVSGASMFVRRAFIEDVGLLNEQYFLYFEEIDWITRAKGKFGLGYCAASQVLHKEGRSIGSAKDSRMRSLFSEHWLSRNRILFTRTFFPLHLPVTLLWTTGVAWSRLLRGAPAQAWTVFTGAWSGLFAKGRKAEF